MPQTSLFNYRGRPLELEVDDKQDMDRADVNFVVTINDKCDFIGAPVQVANGIKRKKDGVLVGRLMYLMRDMKGEKQARVGLSRRKREDWSKTTIFDISDFETLVPEEPEPIWRGLVLNSKNFFSGDNIERWVGLYQVNTLDWNVEPKVIGKKRSKPNESWAVVTRWRNKDYVLFSSEQLVTTDWNAWVPRDLTIEAWFEEGDHWTPELGGSISYDGEKKYEVTKEKIVYHLHPGTVTIRSTEDNRDRGSKKMKLADDDLNFMKTFSEINKEYMQEIKREDPYWEIPDFSEDVDKKTWVSAYHYFLGRHSDLAYFVSSIENTRTFNPQDFQEKYQAYLKFMENSVVSSSAPI